MTNHHFDLPDTTPLQVLQQARSTLDCNVIALDLLIGLEATPWQARQAAKLNLADTKSAIASIDACLGAGLPAAAPTDEMLRKAFNLGQTYWRQADSDSYRLNAESDKTLAKFNQLVADAAALASPAPAAAPSVEPTDVFWLYELTKGEGVYQGCRGPNAEKIMRMTVSGIEEAGEPFPVFASPLGGEPRIDSSHVAVTPEQVVEAIAKQWDGCMTDMVSVGEVDIGAAIRSDGVPFHLAAPQSSRTSVEAPANAPSAEGSACHCPCCREGIEAPHEYHLERRLMSGGAA